MFKAVIYARCSTEEESQKDALKKQKEEAKLCVQENGWTLVDCYVESRSGTTTKGREEYNRLYEDLLYDKFDIIVIKSQDRLMRNTKDWYLFIERLTKEKKQLYMYIERKFYTPEDALVTGIKAILAEEYSRELSKKINNAHRNRQKNNGAVILNSNTYGFRKLPDKSIVLEEEEAKIKKRMYELCAAGNGSRKISKILQAEGIYNRDGKPFSDTAILRILKNPLNKGTVVMNQRHFDFETKKMLKVPNEEQYIYENKVPRTVSDELWEKVNREIARRKSGGRGKYQGKSILSGKLYCGECGLPYYRRTRKRYKDGSVIYEWHCKQYLVGERTCQNIHLDENTLYRFLKSIKIRSDGIAQELLLKEIFQIVRACLKEENTLGEIEHINQEQERIRKQEDCLLDKLINGVISDTIYKRKQAELQKVQAEITKRLSNIKKWKEKEEGVEKRMQQIKRFLEKEEIIQRAITESFLEEVEKLWIYPKHLEIQFYSSNRISMPYGNLFQYRKKKQEEREQIVQILSNNPNITAKEMAVLLGCSLSGINYKLKVLKKEGRIRFIGRGGHGAWYVLK